MFRDTEQELKRLEEELLAQEQDRTEDSDGLIPEYSEELELEEILREFSDPDQTQVFQGDEAFRERIRNDQARRVYNGDRAGEPANLEPEEPDESGDFAGLAVLTVVEALGMAVALIWMLLKFWR